MPLKEFSKQYGFKYKTVWAHVKAKKLKGFEIKQFGRLWRIKG